MALLDQLYSFIIQVACLVLVVWLMTEAVRSLFRR